MAAVTWFEVGSLFCGVAPSVNFLIFGRSVAGVGAAGSKFTSISYHISFTNFTTTVFVSILSIIGEITRLEDRSKLFGYAKCPISLGCINILQVFWCRLWLVICPWTTPRRCIYWWASSMTIVFYFRQADLISIQRPCYMAVVSSTHGSQHLYWRLIW